MEDKELEEYKAAVLAAWTNGEGAESASALWEKYKMSVQVAESAVKATRKAWIVFWIASGIVMMAVAYYSR